MWSGIVQRAAYELISTVAYRSPSSPAGGDDDKHPEKVFLVFFFHPQSATSSVSGHQGRSKVTLENPGFFARGFLCCFQ